MRTHRKIRIVVMTSKRCTLSRLRISVIKSHDDGGRHDTGGKKTRKWRNNIRVLVTMTRVTFLVRLQRALASSLRVRDGDGGVYKYDRIIIIIFTVFIVLVKRVISTRRASKTI